MATDSAPSVRIVRQLLASSLAGGERQIDEHVAARWQWSSAGIFDNETEDSWPTAYANTVKLANTSACSFDGLCDLVFPASTLSRWQSMGPILQCPRRLLKVVGGRRLCAASHLLRIGKRETCSIVSLGSANSYKFEERIHQEYPWCRIHTVDCTVEPQVPPQLQGVLTFHQVCLDKRDAVRHWPTPFARIPNRNDTKVFLSWNSLVSRLGLSAAPPILLKMDVEGYEWDLMPSIIGSNAPPLEIAFEIHAKGHGMLPWRWRLRSPFEIGAFMDYLFTRGGYVLVDRAIPHDAKHWTAIDMTVQRVVTPSLSAIKAVARRAR